MARRFKPTWTQDDYQRVKKDYHRHNLMAKAVDSVITSGLDHTQIAKRSGVSPSTVNRWVTGATRNAKIDTIMSVLGVLNMEMVLVRRKEAQDHIRKERATHVRIKRATAS
jgi:transcriptional regulator with XRE-family HTH domain